MSRARSAAVVIRARCAAVVSRAGLAAVALVLALPAQVLACPVCSPGRDDATRQAFFDTTIFLSLLPLAMFGGVVYWFVRRARAAEALDAPARELAATSEE